MVYLFDGSLEGLLTAVFDRFERKDANAVLKLEQIYQPDAFREYMLVITDRIKADRVWNGLKKRLNQAWIRKIYCAYLSELPEVYNSTFEFICYIFQEVRWIEFNYGNEHVLAVTKTATRVEREKHRMEAFIRFRHAADGIFYCGIAPDFNVLPLIINHFKNRYADQHWLIYDVKRGYGIYYNLLQIEEITIDLNSHDLRKMRVDQFHENEKHYTRLWAAYFKSTTIESRKNTKLHIKHVPKRYWRYLTEKQEN